MCLFLVMSSVSMAGQRISLDVAKDLTIEQSESLDALSDQVDELEDQYNSALATSINLGKQVDEINDYRILYSLDIGGGDLTEDEEDRLDHYKLSYGPFPPTFDRETWIQMNVAGKYLPGELKYAFKSLKTQYEQLKLGTEFQVTQKYNTLVYLNELLEVQEFYLDILKKDYEGAGLKYDLGSIDEISLLRAEVNYDNQKMSVENLNLSIENLMMDLNKMMGREVKESFTTDNLMDYTINDAYEYKALMDEALATSDAFTYTKTYFDLMGEKNEFYQSIGSSSDSEVLEAEISYLEAQNTYDSLIDTIKKDSLTRYSSLMSLAESYDEKVSSYKTAIKDYKNGRSSLEAGFINPSTFKMIEFQLKLQQVEFKNAIRSYNAEKEYINNLLERGLF